MELTASYAIHRLATEMNRVADVLLLNKMGISYGHFYFLFTLSQQGPVTQHALARALGYSDPAVSTMAKTLVASGFIQITVNPTHRRKHIVTITRQGTLLLTQSLDLLEQCFISTMHCAGVDIDHYTKQTVALMNALNHKKGEL